MIEVIPPLKGEGGARSAPGGVIFLLIPTRPLATLASTLPASGEG